MILNTTYRNKEHKDIIQELTGASFSFLESFKMKGIGSKRMIIKEVSPNLQSYISTSSSINYANIELRKEGVLVYINKDLQNFTWAIPYAQLVIFKSNSISIHGQGKYIQFENNNMLKENKSFFNKMIDKKIEYEDRYSF